jgi:hypothetical protein
MFALCRALPKQSLLMPRTVKTRLRDRVTIAFDTSRAKLTVSAEFQLTVSAKVPISGIDLHLGRQSEHDRLIAIAAALMGERLGEFGSSEVTSGTLGAPDSSALE